MYRAIALLSVATLVSCGLPSPREDVRLGREVADSMEAQIGKYEDESLEAYVAGIGRRIEPHLGDTPFSYSYSILDQPEPNAFAAPGGFVYVSRGLLALAESEDEIATVLGHEIVHVERRHTMKQMSRMTLPGILSLPGRVVGNVISRDLGQLINAPIGGLTALTQARYGRSQESDSDRVGQSLAASAGYDPASLAPILDRMEAFASAVTGKDRRPSFFDSHPPTPDRSREARQRAQSLTVAPRPAEALDHAAYLRRVEGVIWGSNPAQGEFRDQVFLHPDLDVAIAFPKGWETVNTASMAGAVAPDQNALVFYGIAGEGGEDEMKRIAAERRDRLERDAGLRPSRDESIDLDGRPGHVLVYTDHSGREATHVAFVWVATGGILHQLVGAAPESEKHKVRDVITSLRALSDAERGSFVEKRIRVVEARSGETIEQLSERTGNVLDPELTALINDVDKAAEFEAGQLLKIVDRSPYRPQ